jgi:hypothetical protein
MIFKRKIHGGILLPGMAEAIKFRVKKSAIPIR